MRKILEKTSLWFVQCENNGAFAEFNRKGKVVELCANGPPPSAYNDLTKKFIIESFLPNILIHEATHFFNAKMDHPPEFRRICSSIYQSAQIPMPLRECMGTTDNRENFREHTVYFDALQSSGDKIAIANDTYGGLTLIGLGGQEFEYSGANWRFDGDSRLILGKDAYLDCSGRPVCKLISSSIQISRATPTTFFPKLTLQAGSTLRLKNGDTVSAVENTDIKTIRIVDDNVSNINRYDDVIPVIAGNLRVNFLRTGRYIDNVKGFTVNSSTLTSIRLGNRDTPLPNAINFFGNGKLRSWSGEIELSLGTAGNCLSPNGCSFDADRSYFLVDRPVDNL